MRYLYVLLMIRC